MNRDLLRKLMMLPSNQTASLYQWLVLAKIERLN